MKLLLQILILPISLLLPASQKSIALPDLLKPQAFEVDSQHLYIIEGHRIHVFSLGNWKKVNSFGRRGEGPGEFFSAWSGLENIRVRVYCRLPLQRFSNTGNPAL